MAAAAVKQFLTATQKKNSNADSRNITTVFRESTPKKSKGANLGEYSRNTYATKNAMHTPSRQILSSKRDKIPKAINQNYKKYERKNDFQRYSKVKPEEEEEEEEEEEDEESGGESASRLERDFLLGKSDTEDEEDFQPPKKKQTLKRKRDYLKTFT